MTLTGKLLNSDATLNFFKEVGSVDFIPGANLSLVIQIFNPEAGIRYVLPSTAVVTFEFQQNSEESLEKTATYLDARDRSLVVVALTQAESENLTGGNLTFTVDLLGDATQIAKGYIQNALRRITAGESCC
jgi:hypothetical protein